MHGWSDCTAGGDAFLHTVHLADPDREVELSAEAQPPPGYAIRSLHPRVVAGTVDARALEGLGALAGTAMVAGLARRAREAMGSLAGTSVFVDALIEVARLARQVVCLPRERPERAAAEGPAALWALDREAWFDLPDSCFTYSDSGAALFDRRAVTCAATPDLYSPRPGQRRVFARRKVARLEHDGHRLRLAHSMHDNVHGFDLVYDVDLATGRVVRAESRISRLPYAGICSEPQAKIHAVLGERLDAGLSKRVQSLLGGPTGCGQLYDLTADLLRLVAGPRVY
jgi:Protein of unknown function (DUF2889)